MNTLAATDQAVLESGSFVESVVATAKGMDTIPLRVGAGVIFAAHGAQKLFGWFGGYGLEGTAGWMASIGLEPGYLMALAAGSAEFFGGLALLAGFLVRPAALVLTVTMLVAIVTAHLANGFFISNGGYEYALALMLVSLALLIRGGGSFSVDRLIESRLK